MALTTGHSYDTDIIAWSNEQSALLRARRFSELDIEHISDEVEDVGKSEQRELAHRIALLLTHLLKWKYQPERRGASWDSTIRTQRIAIESRLRKTPSLKASIEDADWWTDPWADAVRAFFSETNLDMELPDVCPWSFESIMDESR
ncbi:MAG: DUF29 domain-containing protein [Ferrovum myxofaciens]|uniref:DUF29 domain-containing protein n=1 Tax=Ferrovum myxofaciens TaxID=416213 RepID=UPI0023574736|nr:DUF29 domain-containing protein [Ferrovum myxofaciens]QKE40481.1 MAG: DUF29 domain-containing protein [Ferrovum myxofaciens]